MSEQAGDERWRLLDYHFKAKKASSRVACIPQVIHRRCSCMQRNTVTIFPPANGDTTRDEFTCVCGVRFVVTALWVSGAEPAAHMETNNPGR